MDLESTLTVFGATIALLLAIGAGFALIKGSYTKARIEALRGDNEDLRQKVNDLRGQVTDLEHQQERERLEKESLSERVSHVENENNLLKQLVTQRADVENLKEILNHHHNTAMEGLNVITTKQNAITTEVVNTKKAIIAKIDEVTESEDVG